MRGHKKQMGRHWGAGLALTGSVLIGLGGCAADRSSAIRSWQLEPLERQTAPTGSATGTRSVRAGRETISLADILLRETGISGLERAGPARADIPRRRPASWNAQPGAEAFGDRTRAEALLPLPRRAPWRTEVAQAWTPGPDSVEPGEEPGRADPEPARAEAVKPAGDGIEEGSAPGESAAITAILAAAPDPFGGASEPGEHETPPLPPGTRAFAVLKSEEGEDRTASRAAGEASGSDMDEVDRRILSAIAASGRTPESATPSAALWVAEIGRYLEEGSALLGWKMLSRRFPGAFGGHRVAIEQLETDSGSESESGEAEDGSYALVVETGDRETGQGLCDRLARLGQACSLRPAAGGSGRRTAPSPWGPHATRPVRTG